MKASLLAEPELQFGRGRHVDPRFGLLELGPADGQAPAAPRTITAGVVGTQGTIEGLVGWLKRCRNPIAERADAKQPNLFPPFPGFAPGVGFESELVFDARQQRAIPARALRALGKIAGRRDRVEAAAHLFVDEMRAICERALPQVLLVAPPLELLQLFEPESVGEGGSSSTPSSPQLHDVLKARAMAHPVPVQYVLPGTYDESKLRKQNTATGRPRQQQDEATRAWNLHTALYYKAGGYPWALVRESSDLQTCFIGISFYRENDDAMATTLAQVFNERGEGVIVRGGPAQLSKLDKQPYLPRDDAERLLRDALSSYRTEHRHLPARVAVHKTSRFTAGEIEGLEAAADADHVDVLELITVGPSSTRFFTPRHGPPFRGTHVVLDDRSQALYATGSIPFYETYPGPYVPAPLAITLDSAEMAPQRHASELLALTKLNWNHSRLDGRDPITTLAARGIGNIVRHVAPNGPIGNRSPSTCRALASFRARAPVASSQLPRRSVTLLLPCKSGVRRRIVPTICPENGRDTGQALSAPSSADFDESGNAGQNLLDARGAGVRPGRSASGRRRLASAGFRPVPPRGGTVADQRQAVRDSNRARSRATVICRGASTVV